MSLSVVIPAFNEEEGLPVVLDRLIAVFEEADLKDAEIIVVDDGSTDGTVACAENRGARVERHLQNMGYGKSLKTGIKAAKHDVIAITDADGTYPVERLPEMLALYHEGFDMVVGQRTGDEYQGSVIKSPLRKVLKFLVEFTAGKRIPDINSGLRIFSRKRVVKFFPRICNTFSFTTSVTLAYLMNDLTVKYTEIDYFKRIGETRVHLFKDSMRTLQYIVQAALYYAPLKIFILMSGVTFLLSVMAFVTTLAFGLVSTFYLGIGGLLATLVIFAMGLIADLLKQILDHQANDAG